MIPFKFAYMQRSNKGQEVAKSDFLGRGRGQPNPTSYESAERCALATQEFSHVTFSIVLTQVVFVDTFILIIFFFRNALKSATILKTSFLRFVYALSVVHIGHSAPVAYFLKFT